MPDEQTVAAARGPRELRKTSSTVFLSYFRVAEFLLVAFVPKFTHASAHSHSKCNKDAVRNHPINDSLFQWDHYGKRGRSVLSQHDISEDIERWCGGGDGGGGTSARLKIHPQSVWRLAAPYQATLLDTRPVISASSKPSTLGKCQCSFQTPQKRKMREWKRILKL